LQPVRGEVKGAASGMHFELEGVSIHSNSRSNSSLAAAQGVWLVPDQIADKSPATFGQQAQPWRTDLLEQHGVVPDQKLEAAALEDSEVEEDVFEPEDDRAALSPEDNLAHIVHRLLRVPAQAQRGQHAVLINLAAGVAAGSGNGAASCHCCHRCHGIHKTHLWRAVARQLAVAMVLRPTAWPRVHK
ncbi:hypothetical protein VaNZ11_008837, partial [Volvox africanus]